MAERASVQWTEKRGLVLLYDKLMRFHDHTSGPSTM
jgi:hypothetical protein